eukprot:1123274-Ditylum_brightwellii.AAC.1
MTKKYSHLPVKIADYKLWKKLCVDLIGSYKVKDVQGKMHELLAVTMINPATSWFEIKVMPNKEIKTVALAVDREWLCWYPRPREVTHNQRGEFTGVEFQELLNSYGIKSKLASSQNPQGKSVMERVHLMLHNMLHTFKLQLQMLDPHDLQDGYLAVCAYAIRAMYHTTTEATPAEL